MHVSPVSRSKIPREAELPFLFVPQVARCESAQACGYNAITVEKPAGEFGWGDYIAHSQATAAMVVREVPARPRMVR